MLLLRSLPHPYLCYTLSVFVFNGDEAFFHYDKMTVFFLSFFFTRKRTDMVAEYT